MGVGQQGAVQLRRRTGELRQHQPSAATGEPLSGHILLGHQIEAVPQGRDPHHIGTLIKAHQLL